MGLSEKVVKFILQKTFFLMKHTPLLKSLGASLMIALSATGGHAQEVITTAASGFPSPYGVATDVAGNIYVADRVSNSIKMVSSSTGVTSTIAGGFADDYGSGFMASMGGLAVDAHLEMPDAIFVDHSGNVFFTDWWNDAAMVIDASTNHITNICGHEDQGCSGDGGEGRLATMAIPGGIWVDNASNAYIVDYGNNRIRKVDATTHIVNTIAGGVWGPALNGVPAITAGFGQINGVCVDNFGNVYISDAGNHVVRRIDHAGLIRTIAGNGTSGYTGDGGQALTASLNTPGCLFINAAGNLFICDAASNCVRVVNVASGSINTVAGTGAMGFSGDGGTPTSAMLSQPMGVWQDAAGVIYIADQGNGRIRKVTGSAYRTNGTNAATTTNAHIFPNPSNGSFTIQMNAVPENGSVEVYNVVGEKVFSGVIDQQQITVSLNQPAGVYSVVIKSATGNTTQKVTIAK